MLNDTLADCMSDLNESMKIVLKNLLDDAATTIIKELDADGSTVLEWTEFKQSMQAFAKKTDEAKEVGRLFFIQEEEKRALLPHYKEYNVKQLTRMLHIEAFDYAVWEKEITEKRNEKPSYLLFDYQNRNPYTHDASFYRIENTRE